ncbi:MAG: DNA-protecting protein DprA [Armatimonadetes bacterium]|nr:DNA-protecting protein DprA [Armatimonadota bacterium]
MNGSSVPGERARERAAWLALAHNGRLRPRKLVQLVKRAGSAQAAWHLLGLPPCEGGTEGGVSALLTPADEAYPRELLQLPDFPALLYHAGNPLPPAGGRVAIVGSRRATPYGLSVAQKLGQELARCGVCVVSGLARGIDAAAHRGTLESGGFPLAVMACGLDIVYPPEHRRLMDEVERSGALLSEYSAGTRPAGWRFPARNRLVAALCDVVVVVEAASRSGALITVDIALDLGREVLAVPGPVGSPTSVGTHQLIREGATMATGVDDILQALGMPISMEEPLRTPEGKELRCALEALDPTGTRPEDLCRTLGIEFPKALALLYTLELEGFARRHAGDLFVPA